MLFDRVYRLLIGKSGEQTGVEITQLRVSFDIKKSTKKNPNKCKVTVWNLTQATRERFEQPNTRIVLYAGYKEDAGPLLIFQGGVTHAYLSIEGPDYQTILELGDGSQEIRDSVISVGYDRGVESKTILSDLSAKMELPLVLPSDAPERIWENGLSYYGASRGLLDKVTSATDLEWSIQNGNIQVIEKGGVTTRQGIVIATDSGMIKSPERVREAKAEKTSTDKTKIIPGKEAFNGWKVETLLMPMLNPGDRVILESKVVEGVFRIQELRHVGDTHEGDWKTELRLVDPNKPLNTPAKAGKGKKAKSKTTTSPPLEIMA
jgi:hypothetical protein